MKYKKEIKRRSLVLRQRNPVFHHCFFFSSLRLVIQVKWWVARLIRGNNRIINTQRYKERDHRCSNSPLTRLLKSRKRPETERLAQWPNDVNKHQLWALLSIASLLLVTHSLHSSGLGNRLSSIRQSAAGKRRSKRLQPPNFDYKPEIRLTFNDPTWLSYLTLGAD